jgi:Uma2 family endonuclease
MRAARSRFRFDEYVQLEAQSAIKHEFLDGEVYAMAGGSPEHAALASRFALALGLATRGGPCEVFSSDLRVRVPATGLTTYPDLTVVCGTWQRDPEDANTITNPVLVIEVLSDSTAAYDRGEKLAHYQRIESLREVLLVAHDSRRLELWRKDEAGRWVLLVAQAGDRLTLRSVPATLEVDELFSGLL